MNAPLDRSVDLEDEHPSLTSVNLSICWSKQRLVINEVSPLPPSKVQVFLKKVSFANLLMLPAYI